MTINVNANAQYGGNLINQKYAPIAVNANPIQDDNQQLYVNLFNNRINVLQAGNLIPSNLNFYCADWNALSNAVNGANATPPIIVISSNRSRWLQDHCGIARDRLAALGLVNFDNPNDLRALSWGPTPWFEPHRVNDGNRTVVMLVHEKEYQTYRAKMVGSGITVVGWSFDINNNPSPDGQVPRGNTMVGFGVSRFAAIELAKNLFTAPAIPIAAERQKCWLVDDNVAHVRAFPGFDNCQDQLDDNVIAMGFGGSTVNEPDVFFINTLVNQNLGVAALNDLQTTGLVQQCSVWNIARLHQLHLNFSPYFVTSNEDSSFSYHLSQRAQSGIRICTGASVVKAQPQHDNSAAARRLNYNRDFIVGDLYDVEKNVSVNNTPLHDFVTDTILPGSQNPREWSIYTESKVVEQLMAKVVLDKNNWVPNRIFQPNGANGQNVQRHTA
ncbi:hypothetical protein N475_19640 [Pseudoalteromonas luteoviolacea DSM 6061]|uniref:Uncharacterized protein n=1 Tax=Pseudoalteromonas luteoviolacea DSM 6061 TaxID=1365250 RepID=A0A166VTZ9_9GAMM|nr:hypothetical protein N475_19640 [Pseudoalteromonas luteoviolacea DSM 6061]MBE0389220.1 hypothetical protein [Pseudoalteromonas luteoviolacea DSM 6061]